MATRSYMSRQEAQEHSFSPAVTLLVPLAAILLQVYVPRLLPAFALVDLPLLVTLFFAVSRRSPIAGTATGAIIGLLQDVITPNQPIGVHGMTMAVIGYAAASLSTQLDVDNIITRSVLTFVFSLMESALLFLIETRLLGRTEFRLMWFHEVLRAVANTAVGQPFFLLLDRSKRRD
jgi:rod shape-determining protein MreD